MIGVQEQAEKVTIAKITEVLEVETIKTKIEAVQDIQKSIKVPQNKVQWLMPNEITPAKTVKLIL